MSDPGRPLRIGIALAGIPSATGEAITGHLRQALPAAQLVPLAPPARPGRGFPGLSAEGLVGAVVVATAGDPVGRALRRERPPSPPFWTVLLPDGVDEAGTVGKAVREVLGWVRAVNVSPPFGPEHLRPRLIREGAFTRRELWTSLGGLRYEVVPAVDPRVCAGARRCGLCVKACPLGAFRVEDGAVAIDTRACDGCGGCVAACPRDAIRFPGGTKPEINAWLEGMLAGAPGPAGAEATAVAFTCARSASALPPPILECPLPCVGAVSAWSILRALELGARAVAVIAGDSPCRERHDPPRWERLAASARLVLEGMGVEGERVAVLDLPAPRDLDRLAGLTGRLGPTPWRARASPGSAPPVLGRLVMRMSRAAPARIPREGPEAPFAFVQADPARCSLCGLCALCPAGAIGCREEGDQVTLTFEYRLCTGCGLCQEVCPEKAIRLRRVFDPARLDEGPRALAGSALVRCRDCGVPIAPSPMLEAIRRRLADRRASPLEDLARCPACRLGAPLSGGIGAGPDRG